jgi:aspartate/methionine/tyrosine aminotransferase
MQGQPMLTEPLAAFLAQFVYQGVKPNPSELVVGTGLSAILSNLFFSLCEAGDAVRNG